MNKSAYTLCLFVLLISCRNTTGEDTVLKDSDTLNAIDIAATDTNAVKAPPSTLPDCDFVYDTIQDLNYQLHLSILDKFHNKDKRGYVLFTGSRDTLNFFLYHQDIAAFILNLNPEETGLYRKLTNKVVYLIIEHEPRMLDHGLTVWSSDTEKLDYFMHHVSNPVCNTQSLDSTLSLIEQEMFESDERAKKAKQLLIKHLEEGIKGNHQNVGNK